MGGTFTTADIAAYAQRRIAEFHKRRAHQLALVARQPDIGISAASHLDRAREEALGLWELQQLATALDGHASALAIECGTRDLMSALIDSAWVCRTAAHTGVPPRTADMAAPSDLQEG